jgi:hypothetical protein
MPVIPTTWEAKIERIRDDSLRPTHTKSYQDLNK